MDSCLKLRSEIDVMERIDNLHEEKSFTDAFLYESSSNTKHFKVEERIARRTDARLTKNIMN